MGVWKEVVVWLRRRGVVMEAEVEDGLNASAQYGILAVHEGFRRRFRAD